MLDRRDWTTEEIELVNFLTHYLSDETIGKLLGRTRLSVIKMRQRNKLLRRDIKEKKEFPLIIIKPRNHYKPSDFLLKDNFD
jgi:hypothetical protein